MREELRSSPQPAWSRRNLRSRACLWTAPCSSSHLNFLKHLGKSAVAINKILARTGQVWQKGYFDHKFRTDQDLAPILNYMWKNPDPPGTNFRCNQNDWIWFKSMVTKDFEYPSGYQRIQSLDKTGSRPHSTSSGTLSRLLLHFRWPRLPIF
jgi:hypothetical protein